LSAGASPQTPLGELTRSQTHQLNLRGYTSKGTGRERTGGKEGSGRREFVFCTRKKKENLACMLLTSVPSSA